MRPLQTKNFCRKFFGAIRLENFDVWTDRLKFPLGLLGILLRKGDPRHKANLTLIPKHSIMSLYPFSSLKVRYRVSN